MTPELAERLHTIAERIVSRSTVEDPRFCEHDAYGEDWPQNLVTGLAEGWLRGRRFGCWLPIAGEMYRQMEQDDSLREMIHGRLKNSWRTLAISALVPMTTLAGPKGKLPA